MTKVFIGGSRHVSRLPSEIKLRLNKMIEKGHHVIVGDANGADKAVQKHFYETAYDNVTVFCSGDKTRNNLGNWIIQNIVAPKNAKGFQFYAAKDREMAKEADLGLMIWDGKSPGTVLNVLRLIRANKIAVLYNVPEKRVINIKTLKDWESFLASTSIELRQDLCDRATPDEWQPCPQADMLDQIEVAEEKPSTSLSDHELAESLNAALAKADPVAVVDVLGSIAKSRGMSQVSRETGLARESLYRSLGSGGNPEFATILKVLSSLGLQLVAGPSQQNKNAKA